ncbi:MAG: hypothetical protein H7Y61_00235 [Rhizobiales bacterium]|nr:hypothetical protein [Rhizobacter sp.]
MKSSRRLFAAALLALGASACAADAADRRFIRSGMAEAEVLLKIGPPDHETFIRNERGRPEEKAWAYFPHSGDAQTLTIITLRAGTVHSVDRKISR